MSFFSRLRSRLDLHSRNTKTSKSESGYCGWSHLKSRRTQIASEETNSSNPTSGTLPRQNKCTGRIQQTHQHVMLGDRESVDLVDLEKAWFARRKSSLHRLSANNMLFKEEIRSPRPSRCFEYVPFVLKVSSEGIEMELNDCLARSQSLSVDDELAEFWALIAKIEAVDTGKHVEDEPQCSESSASDYANYKVAAVLSSDQSDNETQSGLPSPQYHRKHRPAPTNVSRTRPTSLTEHHCNISDTPLTMAGQWPASARSVSSFTPTRSGTAATVDSSLILEWW